MHQYILFPLNFYLHLKTGTFFVLNIYIGIGIIHIALKYKKGTRYGVKVLKEYLRGVAQMINRYLDISESII
ncbi:MAG: hypothetical protein Hyperionvirus3_46 [Hyperionvirus sp.]|uniref:Uncharacterized protein n=1 Tax=Hyperionvirus sp. TaxID=2487770 RepID=A0A3G5A6L1_9VIRU|nr:MAG: hypothetical protein Hyperionvirus3_46 [Hyperionvirus sp.]